MKTKFNGILTLLLALVVQLSFAQEKTVRGNVSDESGPLPGVSVIIKGTTKGAETDYDGNYTIQAKQGDILVYSYVGLNTVEKTVGASNTINLVMTGSNVLDEVIVTAVGIKRKPKEMSYSVQKVKNEDLTKTKATNVATAMVGKVSGLQINTVNNGVNPDTRVVLRGNRSLLGNNQALVVIDGYPVSKGALSRLNTSDIENVTVLKGANASALYGSEAANGVLIITTKKGKGKFNVTFSTSAEFSSVAYLPEIQDQFGSGGFPDGTLYPLENVAWGPRFDGQMVDASETLADGTSWKVPYSPIKNRNKDFFNTGLTTRNGISINAGDETSDFLLSLDHAMVSGIVPKNKFNRTNLRLKASKKYGKFRLGGNFSFYRSHSNTVASEAGRQGRAFYWTVINTPLHIPLNEMRNWRDGKYTRNEVSFFRFYENPWFIIDTQREKNNFKDFTAIVDANYDITEWLTATFKAGFTGTSGTYKKETGAYTYDFKVPHAYYNMSPYGATTADGLSSGTRVNTDLLFTMNKNISEDFSTKLIVGQNMKLTDYKTINISGNDLIVPDFYNISTRKGEPTVSERTQKERKLGVYGDLTLGYKDFIYLNFTARNDWTSTFNSNNRSFFYPGAGISFIATNAFPSLISDKGLGYLKASFNVTKTGNNTVPYKVNETFYAPDNFPYGTTTAGLSQSTQVRNPNLGPEFTTSMEAGLEFSLFRSRISGNITGYKTNTTDQLVPIDVSYASGAGSYFTNIGEIENLGLEVDLNAKILKTDNFSWDLGINYSGFKSEVVSLSEGVDELGIGGFNNNSVYVVAKVGEPYPLLRTTSYLRDNQGRVIVDEKGDPVKDTKNRVQGKTTPDYILGLNSSISYKGWKLYAVMDYRTGHVFYNSIVDALEFTGLTKHSVMTGRQPFVFPNSSYSDGNGGYVENTNRLTSGAGNKFWSTTYNDIKENYVTDATTLKLREVSLSYEFGEETLKNIGISSLTIGAYGKNLLTFRPSANVYTDPEFGYTTGNAIGIGTQAQTPPTRQYGLNVTVQF